MKICGGRRDEEKGGIVEVRHHATDDWRHVAHGSSGHMARDGGFPLETPPW